MGKKQIVVISPQEIIKDAIRRNAHRGSREDFTYEDVEAALKCSSVANFFSFGHDKSRTHRFFLWHSINGIVINWGQLEVRFHAIALGSDDIHYRTIPQMITALEEALPAITKMSHETEALEDAQRQYRYIIECNERHDLDL